MNQNICQCDFRLSHMCSQIYTLGEVLLLFYLMLSSFLDASVDIWTMNEWKKRMKRQFKAQRRDSGRLIHVVTAAAEQAVLLKSIVVKM